MCTKEEVNQLLIEHRKKIQQDVTEFDRRIDNLERLVEEIVDYNKKMGPILQGLSDTFTGGKLLGKVSTVIVKFLITVTAISGAIIWLKEWVKK